jgi:hypothetical protein
MRTFKLYVDTASEVCDILAPHADGTFWQFESTPIETGAVYVVGRLILREHLERIKSIVLNNEAHVVFSNPAEASETLKHQFDVIGVKDLVLDKKIPVIAGGDMEDEFPHLKYERFLVDILNYDENIQAMQHTNEIFLKTKKPYKFLFLNGRIRSHRKFLIEKFNLTGLLDNALWTCLDSQSSPARDMLLWHNGENLMFKDSPIHYLDKQYEFDFYQDNVNKPQDVAFVKHRLFNNQWGEIYLKPDPYVDTYFSLVTETVFNHPYSFFTEKIAKPLAMGHPWIVAGNYGYYRDIKKLGFKTFGHLIDESFDTIDSSQDRIERIAKVVDDLCQTDLPAFLAEAQEICIYNQQHLKEVAGKLKSEFPSRLINFIGQQFFNE